MMFPLVVTTYPENGATEANLDEIIRITFSETLDLATVTPNNVTITNYNTNTDVTDAAIEMSDEDTTVIITIPKNATGEHRLEGLSEYRIVIAGVKSKSGHEMPGTFELKFTTKASDIKEIVNPPIQNTFFEVLRTYPKNGAVLTPSTIKIQCSKDIKADSDLSGIMMVDGDIIKSIDDALFIGVNMITQDSVNINGSIIEITPPELESGKKYTIIIIKITDLSDNEVLPFMYSFYASPSPMYSTIKDINSETSIQKFTSHISEYDIAIRIHNNSKLAKFIAKEAENTDADFVTPALYVSEYVKTKTQYDILFDRFIEITSGATSKQLKDLSVEYGFSPSDLLKMADRLKLRYQYWEDFLKGRKNRGNAKATSFNKGSEIDENPGFMDRKLKDMEGNKTW